MPTVDVAPVSGSGWVVAGVPRELAPEPFTMALVSSQPKRWLGLVLDSGHEFAGRRVELKQLHDEWTGEVEIIVEPARSGDGRSTGVGLTCTVPRPSQF
jgi:hypothetical protein